MPLPDHHTEITRRFVYRAPRPDTDQALKFQQVRDELGATAHTFDGLLPDGREKALAITKLEEAMFWANAAIARNGGPA